MYNSITFKSGSFMFLTTEESASLSKQLLDGNNFVSVPRVPQIWNKDIISFVGENDIFNDKKVKGATFSFCAEGLYARVDEKEFYWNGKEWSKANPGTFATGKTFDEFVSK